MFITIHKILFLIHFCNSVLKFPNSSGRYPSNFFLSRYNYQSYSQFPFSGKSISVRRRALFLDGMIVIGINGLTRDLMHTHPQHNVLSKMIIFIKDKYVTN